MKNILLVGCFLSQFQIFAQVYITSSDMPASGDVLIQENATWNGNWNLDQTGTGQSWNVSASVLAPLGTYTTVNCEPLTNAPFAYQFFFNSPFDPDHNSDYTTITAPPSLPTDQLPLPIPITIENTYAFYQVTNSRYALTGFGASISGFPTGAQGNPIDIIYPLPLSYPLDQTNDSYFQYDIPALGTYATAQTRRTEVLAEGNMNFFGTDYPVLKVKSTVTGTDSLYISQFSFGFSFPRPEAVEYKWLTPGIKVPLLQINTALGATTGALIYSTGPNSIDLNVQSDWTVFPNPGSSLNIRTESPSKVKIVDEKGSVVFYNNVNALGQWDASSLAQGTYFIEINGVTKKWMKK
jgi:hypothetical protein